MQQHSLFACLRCKFVSQLILYCRASSKYHDFVSRSGQLVTKLKNQGYVLTRLKAAFKKFYGRHHNLVDNYNLAMSQMANEATIDILEEDFSHFGYPHTLVTDNVATLLSKKF